MTDIIRELITKTAKNRKCPKCHTPVDIAMKDKKRSVDVVMRHYCSWMNGNSKITVTLDKKGFSTAV